MAGKRKRVGTSEEGSRASASTDRDTTATNGNLPVADQTFEVQIVGDGKNIRKGRAGPQGWSDVCSQNELEPNGPKCEYRVRPNQAWDSMRKYKNFVVSDKTFGVGDYVFIYHGTEAQGANLDPSNASSWVAQVLEIRAQDASHVYLRVFWLYWPDELPMGRQPYHGSNELVASNFMMITDAMTVTDRAEVTHVQEDFNEAPAEGLYWRQSYDIMTKKLSALRKDCKCNAYHNPDRRLIRCPQCEKNLHEDCLLHDALSRKWEALEAEKKEAEENPASDTIEVDEKVKSKSRSSNTPVAKGKKKGKRAKLTSFPWEGKLEASLEMKTDDNGEEANETTGKVVIYQHGDGNDDEAETFKEDLRCLHKACGKLLSGEPDQPNGISS